MRIVKKKNKKKQTFVYKLLKINELVTIKNKNKIVLTLQNILTENIQCINGS